ncbi:MAG TPA: cation:proton antiporter [Methylomirabilota bacterium]|nr:cation:proton antiporter [Methylomirabilota bacterium]
MHFAELLLGLALIWLAAKAAGEGAERLGQPAVLGELLAGVVVGPHALGWVDESHILAALAEIGVVILLFEIGLESDLEELLRAGVQSAAVAAVGIVGPFAAGYALGRWWGLDPLTAIFLGATLTATSVGITARVLADLGRLQDPAARVVLGAAVMDDVLGLVILAVPRREGRPRAARCGSSSRPWRSWRWPPASAFGWRPPCSDGSPRCGAAAPSSWGR